MAIWFIPLMKKKETEINISDEALALEYNVDCSTISGIIRKKEDLLKTYSNAKTSELKRTRIQPSRFPVLEDALYKWFQGLRSQNIPVSQELLKKKVMYFYNEAKNRGVQFPQFEVSNGWLENFQNQYGISSKNITEIADEPTSNDILEELVDGLRKVNINCTNNLTMSAEDFVNIDSSVITTELPTDEDIRDLNQAYNDDKFTEENSIHKNNLKRKLEDDELPDYDELAFLFNDENALGEESRLPLANDSKDSSKFICKDMLNAFRKYQNKIPKTHGVFT
ncbi:14408_t:CDS:2 [Entrophospora sp. SA101]|nr:14408_t:CDS:2 [Entrophospora sp. SA101]